MGARNATRHALGGDRRRSGARAREHPRSLTLASQNPGAAANGRRPKHIAPTLLKAQTLKYVLVLEILQDGGFPASRNLHPCHFLSFLSFLAFFPLWPPAVRPPRCQSISDRAVRRWLLDGRCDRLSDSYAAPASCRGTTPRLMRQPERAGSLVFLSRCLRAWRGMHLNVRQRCAAPRGYEKMPATKEPSGCCDDLYVVFVPFGFSNETGAFDWNESLTSH